MASGEFAPPSADFDAASLDVATKSRNFATCLRASERRREISEQRLEPSPRRRQTSERRLSTSPRRRETSPRRLETSPRRLETSERRLGTSPLHRWTCDGIWRLCDDFGRCRPSVCGRRNRPRDILLIPRGPRPDWYKDFGPLGGSALRGRRPAGGGLRRAGRWRTGVGLWAIVLRGLGASLRP